jgi:hypothetical protein
MAVPAPELPVGGELEGLRGQPEVPDRPGVADREPGKAVAAETPLLVAGPGGSRAGEH